MKPREQTAPISEAPGAALAARALAASPYEPPGPRGFRIDLRLDANEGPRQEWDAAAAARLLGDGCARRYPSTRETEALLAERWGTDPDRVIVTAGGDDAIDRLCRALLEPGRELVFPSPSFEMIERSALLAGGAVVRVPWRLGAYPTAAVLASVNPRTVLIAVVSPNNPTGATATRDDLRRLSAAAPGAVLLVDLAYAEFADEDLTGEAIRLPNAVAVRTFSKAYGLAGLRVGYAVGPAPLVRAMRAVSGPYPVSSISLAIAADRLREPRVRLAGTVARVREERERLIERLSALGAAPFPSQANFVLCGFPRAEWVWSALASLGVAVRRFPAGGELEGCLRIGLPCEDAEYRRLEAILTAALRPDAILFDMDGVLADVSGSYRRAIRLTAESFGVRLDAAEISAAKSAGDATNDWVVTQRLLAGRGVDAPLDRVTRRFESLYQGSEGRPGLHEHERLIPPVALLRRLASRRPLGIVTGRPRRDAERFLARFGVADLFRTLVCLEDAPSKPDPASVLLALERLGARTAWMIGDTPDDIRAASAARGNVAVVPIGVASPSDEPTGAASRLSEAGAAAVLPAIDALEDLLS